MVKGKDKENIESNKNLAKPQASKPRIREPGL